MTRASSEARSVAAPPSGDDATTGSARGWYPDPTDPRRERWHDGEGFTNHTHRSLRRASVFGADVDRSMWSGANVAARNARRASDAATVLFLLSIVGVVIGPSAPWAPTAVGIMLWALTGAAALQILLGVRGVARARRDGGLALSVSVIAQGSVYLLVGLGYLLLRFALSFTG